MSDNLDRAYAQQQSTGNYQQAMGGNTNTSSFTSSNASKPSGGYGSQTTTQSTQSSSNTQSNQNQSQGYGNQNQSQGYGNQNNQSQGYGQQGGYGGGFGNQGGFGGFGGPMMGGYGGNNNNNNNNNNNSNGNNNNNNNNKPQGGYGGFGGPMGMGMGMGGFGGPMGMGGFGGFFPQNPFSYNPQQFNYGGGYNRLQAFFLPLGIPPMIGQKMQKASNAFREFDKDNTGTLDKEEWKKCVKSLNISIPESDYDALFGRIDRDNSGKVSEREFCEWYSSCY